MGNVVYSQSRRLIQLIPNSNFTCHYITSGNDRIRVAIEQEVWIARMVAIARWICSTGLKLDGEGVVTIEVQNDTPAIEIFTVLWRQLVRVVNVPPILFLSRQHTHSTIQFHNFSFFESTSRKPAASARSCSFHACISCCFIGATWVPSGIVGLRVETSISTMLTERIRVVKSLLLITSKLLLPKI